MARHGVRRSVGQAPPELEPGLDDGSRSDELAAQMPQLEPGTELVGSFRDEGGLIVPEVRPVYPALPPPAPVSAVLCTGCQRPVPVGAVLLDAHDRPWCSSECHKDWSGWDGPAFDPRSGL